MHPYVCMECGKSNGFSVNVCYDCDIRLFSYKYDEYELDQGYDTEDHPVSREKQDRLDAAEHKECSECEGNKLHDQGDYLCIDCRDAVPAT